MAVGRDSPVMKRRSLLWCSILAFPIAWLVAGAFAWGVVVVANSRFGLNQAPLFLVWIGSWCAATIVLTVGFGMLLQSPTDSTEESTVSKGSRFLVGGSWLLAGLALAYLLSAIAFWSKQ